jgi:signal transduction histidine kinase
MTASYSPQGRAERLIATGRVGLVALTLLAIWVEPSALAISQRMALAALTAYLVGAALLLLWMWRSPAPLGRLPQVSHAFDLAAFCLVVVCTRGATGPVFLYATFSLAGAMLRWRWRGVLWTAGAVLAAHTGLGMVAAILVGGPAVQPARVAVQGLGLAMLAALLGCLGAYEEWVRDEIFRLASWPRALPREAPALVRDLLQHTAELLGAPRVLMGWEEPEEPWFHLASWSRGEFQWNRQPPGTYEPLVAEPLAGADFLCPDAGAALPTSLHTSSAGLHRVQGPPLHPDLQTRFAIGAILSLRLQGEVVKGRLFCLDKSGLTVDDLLLGEFAARQVASCLDHFYLQRRLQQAAATDERIRLARELHDGVLQSLTGAALQLQTVGPLLETDRQAARDRLLGIQRLLLEEQRDLRFFVQELRPAPLGLPGVDSSLAVRLKQLAERIERHWGLRVELRAERVEAPISEALLREIYLIVHEALVNAARHAQASTARVGVELLADRVRIVVADDGRGFRFRGRYDHAALTDMKLGPVTLKERIAALHGSIVIDSQEAGARLEIILPLVPPGD